jgi:hypothetical protein
MRCESKTASREDLYREGIGEIARIGTLQVMEGVPSDEAGCRKMRSSYKSSLSLCPLLLSHFSRNLHRLQGALSGCWGS